MKWFSISSDPRQKIYELRTRNDKLLTLTYHSQPGTLRIIANDEKRVFFVAREGFIRVRTVMRNEYGIRMGQVIHENGQNDIGGNIEISGEEFGYKLRNGDAAEVVLFKNGVRLVACEMPDVSKSISGDGSYDVLILTLCWYLASSVKKPIEAYA